MSSDLLAKIRRLKARIRLLAYALTLLYASIVPSDPPAELPTVETSSVATLAPTIGDCPSEDSEGLNGKPCRWDSLERGNGIGISFVAYPDGSAHYVDHYYPPCPFVLPMGMVPELTAPMVSACVWDSAFIYVPDGDGMPHQLERELGEIIREDFTR